MSNVKVMPQSEGFTFTLDIINLYFSGCYFRIILHLFLFADAGLFNAIEK
jgi:hypothetical protein